MTDLNPPSSTAPTAKGAPQVQVWLTRPGQVRCHTLEPELISDVLEEPGTLLWVDIRDPGEAEIAMLREEFGFHSLALEDAMKQRQRPKVDEYPGYYFVVLYAPQPMGETSEVEMDEVDLFVGRNYVVSLHYGDVPALSQAIHVWQRIEAELHRDVGFLLHTIVDTVIDAYFPIVDDIEDRLDSLELTLFGSGRDFAPRNLVSLKRTLYTLRKAIYPLREVFNTFLRRDQALFNPETLPYFQDVYDHVLRLLDTLDIQREMATGTLEAQLSVASNRLNATMQRLTLLAICVAIMGAVFGAWGMNFDEVPFHELKQTGFFLVCGFTVLLTAAAIAWAKRNGLW